MAFHWAKFVHENLLSSFNDLFDQLKPKYGERLNSAVDEAKVETSKETNETSSITTNVKEDTSRDSIKDKQSGEGSNDSSNDEKAQEDNSTAISKPSPIDENFKIDEFPVIDESFIERLKEIIGDELSSLLKSTDDAYEIRVKNIDNQISAIDFDYDKLRHLYETSSFSEKRAIMFLFASPFHIINHLLDDYKNETFQDMFDSYFFMKLPRLILPFDELFSNFTLYDCLTNPFILDVQLLELNPDEISDDKCEDTLMEIAGIF